MSAGRPRAFAAMAAVGAMAATALIQACAMPMEPSPSPTTSGGCQAQRAEAFVGRRPTPELAESARMLAGGQSVRVLAHNQMVTKEYKVDRLNIHLAPDGTIERLTCG